MAEISINLPDDMKSKIEAHPEIDWARVFKQGVEKRLQRSERFRKINELLKNSTLTDEQCLKFGDELKRRVAKRHGL